MSALESFGENAFCDQDMNLNTTLMEGMGQQVEEEAEGEYIVQRLETLERGKKHPLGTDAYAYKVWVNWQSYDENTLEPLENLIEDVRNMVEPFILQ